MTTGPATPNRLLDVAASLISVAGLAPGGCEFETPGVTGCIITRHSGSPGCVQGGASLREEMGLSQVWGSGSLGHSGDSMDAGLVPEFWKDPLWASLSPQHCPQQWCVGGVQF